MNLRPKFVPAPPSSRAGRWRLVALTSAAVLVAGVAVPTPATAGPSDQRPLNRPPVVTLTSPTAGQNVPIPGTLTLAANAYDIDGSITKVEFYVGNTRVGVDTTAPYTVSISTTTIGFGAFGAKARAYDNGYPPLTSDSGVVPFYVVTIPPEPPSSRVSNPYSGARQYVNPDWSQRVHAQAAQTPGELGRQMATTAGFPTAVWLDEIADITAGDGLAGHLDEALAQQSTGRPVVVQLVLYNLPNRDCARLGAPGELLISADGMARYRAEFIDQIVSILSRPAYTNLRIVTVVEPGALGGLVTGMNAANPVLECVEAYYNGAYVEGIRYALNQLKTLRNVYSYLDLSSSARLGWDDYADLTLQLVTRTLTEGSAPGVNSVAGFATDVAEYVPVVEPFLPDPHLLVGDRPIYQFSYFYDWNKIFDELDYAQLLRNALIQRGLPSSIGMMIDTGRNGWGGTGRPTQVSTSGDPNTYVDESRVDRRPLRYDWCNQTGAGLGERPVANPAPGVHAYAWLKPPGESDGVSSPLAAPEPERDYLQHRNACNPEGGNNEHGSNRPTNALPNAPHHGRWFPEFFAQLVRNAYPPVPAG